MSEEQFQFFENTHARRMAFSKIAKVPPCRMVSTHPRVGDLVVVRLNPWAVGVLVVTAGADHRLLHSPYQTVQDALDHARLMAASSLVDVWHRTSSTTFELIASYRGDAGSP